MVLVTADGREKHQIEQEEIKCMEILMTSRLT